MRLLPVLAFALFSTPAFADALTFGGVIGGQDTLLEITQPSDGAVAGRYTFTDAGGDVPLVAAGTRDGGTVWLLTEEAPCGEGDCVSNDNGVVVDPPVAATWEVVYDPETLMLTATRTAGDEVSTGEFYLMGSRPLDEGEEVTAAGLHGRSAVFIYSPDKLLAVETAPYEMALLDLELPPGKSKTLGAATWHYVADPRTRFGFPRIASFAGGEPVDAANAVLADRHYRMSLSALGCLAYRYAAYGVNEWQTEAGGTLAGYEDETIRLTYASPRLVSWTESGSLYCGGAHPANHHNSYTYDLETGAPLQFSRLFSAWVPREWGAALDELADTDLAFENPEAYQWGPDAELAAFVRNSIPEDVLTGEAELDEACYGIDAIAEHLDIRFTDLNGAPAATFTLSGFPHVLSVCNTDLFTAPLAELEPFLGPAASDYFPELGG